MLCRLKRQVDAGLGPDLARPHPAAEHHVFGRDRLTVFCPHPSGCAVLVQDLIDPHAFKDPRAAHPSALGQGHCDIDRIGASVFGNVKRRRHI